MKIVIDDKIPFIKGVLEPYADVVYLPGGKISPEDVVDAKALVTRTRTKCDEHLLAGSSIEIITTATIGYDHIDVSYCNKAGIKWQNAPGCNSGSVLQYVASVFANLVLKKNISLKGKTLGVVGVGNVGSKIARLGATYDMKVLLNDPPRERLEGSEKFTNLDRLLQESDIVSLHVPLIREGIDKTFHLLNEQTLAKMKPDSILINTSRGEAIRTGALTNALHQGKLGKVVLDVWENEPEINRQLLQMTEIATPHIAGYSKDGKANGTAISIQAISRHFELGLDHWYPVDLPSPSQPILSCPISENTEKTLSTFILSTYDVMDDDARLRLNTDEFEYQRGAYPDRREFQAYSVLSDYLDITTAKKLSEVGFSILK